MPVEQPRRKRMSGRERREQLIDISRQLFAARGFEGTSIEEIATTAGVSKPVVYEHFGGKEGLYAVVVDREVGRLLRTIGRTAAGAGTRNPIERLVWAWLNYVSENPEGFRILTRDMSIDGSTFRSVTDDLAIRFEPWISEEIVNKGGDPNDAPVSTQMILGAIVRTVAWWFDTRKIEKEMLAAQLIRMLANSLRPLEDYSPATGQV